MLHSKKENSKINHLQERTLKVVRNGYIAPFDDLLK